MLQRRLLDALGCICAILNESEAVWALTGSMGFALHGIETPVHDIDIQTDRSGTYEIEKRLEQHVTRRVHFSETKSIKSHFGALRIDGVDVEIMGDIQKRLPDGTWEPPVDIRRHREFIEVNGLRIPALSIEYEVQAYETLGRMEKAQQLRCWLNKQNGPHLREPMRPAEGAADA